MEVNILRRRAKSRKLRSARPACESPVNRREFGPVGLYHSQRGQNAPRLLMNVSPGKSRLAVIDTDSGFLRVLARRLEAAGWEYRIFSGPVPADELVAMKLNALLVDFTAVEPLGWEFIERVGGMLPQLGLVVCTQGATMSQRVRGLRARQRPRPRTRPGRR